MSLLPDWLTGYDEENAQAAAAADAEIKRLNVEDYGPFYVGSDTQSYQPADQRAEVDDEFFTAATRFPRWSASVVGRYLLEFLRLIPWWVWVGLALVLFAWLGGFSRFKGALAK